MNNDWCPENDGAYRMELAARERETIASLRARLEQAEREIGEWRLAAKRSHETYYAGGFRAGIEAAADWIETAPRGYPHSAYRDSIRALSPATSTDTTPSVAEAAKVICDAWDADTLPVNDPDPMLPSFIAALRALADNTTSVADPTNRVESICRELRNAGYMVPVSVMDRALAAQKGDPQ